MQERANNGSVTANYLVGLGLDQPFIRTAGSSTSYYLSDALGSIVGLASTTGTVPTSYTYEPYGKTTVSGTSSASFLGFTGRENDSTGTLSLYNYRFRYYSPVFSRFMAGRSWPIRQFRYQSLRIRLRSTYSAIRSAWPRFEPRVIRLDLSEYLADSNGRLCDSLYDSFRGGVLHTRGWMLTWKEAAIVQQTGGPGTWAFWRSSLFNLGTTALTVIGGNALSKVAVASGPTAIASKWGGQFFSAGLPRGRLWDLEMVRFPFVGMAPQFLRVPLMTHKKGRVYWTKGQAAIVAVGITLVSGSGRPLCHEIPKRRFGPSVRIRPLRRGDVVRSRQSGFREDSMRFQTESGS